MHTEERDGDLQLVSTARVNRVCVHSLQNQLKSKQIWKKKAGLENSPLHF